MKGLDGFHRQALEILRSDRVRSALDLTREPDSIRDDYGRSLARAGGPCRAEADRGRGSIRHARVRRLGHARQQLPQHYAGQLLPPLDQALSALIRDLASRGLLDETIVVCAGEFGRTPRVNPAGGRDHWSQSMTALLAGGGILGGSVHGATDARGTAPAVAPCSPDDLAATIFHRLGFGPRHEVTTAGGRPIAIFREGRVLDSLIA